METSFENSLELTESFHDHHRCHVDHHHEAEGVGQGHQDKDDEEYQMHFVGDGYGG